MRDKVHFYTHPTRPSSTRSRAQRAAWSLFAAGFAPIQPGHRGGGAPPHRGDMRKPQAGEFSPPNIPKIKKAKITITC